MVTARLPLGMVWARSSAGPLRVLWLAALLFGVLAMHGASAESATSHLSISGVILATGPIQDHADEESAGDIAAYTVLEAEASDHHDGGHEPSHPAQECVSGQPQQGAGLSVPCPARLDWEPPCRAHGAGKSFPAGPIRPFPL
jgi:hypothetical protein